MNPLDILRPNYLGDILVNRGVDELTQNRGLGVNEVKKVNPQGMLQREESSNPTVFKDKLRAAKAKQFRKTKETVGF